MGQREKLGKEPSGRGQHIFEETGRNKKKKSILISKMLYISKILCITIEIAT